MPATSPPGLTVITGRGRVPIPLRSRTQLLKELAGRPAAAAVGDALDAAGPAGMIQLDATKTEMLLGVLHDWAERVTVPKLPPGIDELRSALSRDLRALNPTADVWPVLEPPWVPWEPSWARTFAPDRKLIEIPEDDVLLLLETLDSGGRLEREAATWIRGEKDEYRPLQPDKKTTLGLLEALGRLDLAGTLTGPLGRLRFELDIEE
jgi:hypothetical protein